MKIRPVGSRIVPCGQTDMKLIVAFRSFKTRLRIDHFGGADNVTYLLQE